MVVLAPAGFRILPLSLTQLSLAAVLKCGQSFRWCIYPLSSQDGAEDDVSPSHEYRLCLRDRVVCLRQTQDTLFYRSVFPGYPLSSESTDVQDAETLAWLHDYFQLDIDLAELYQEWGSRDPVFQALKHRFEGIRMLRQDPFENLISFICSSNNNISRITKMVKSLCQHYSPPLLTLPVPGFAPLSGTSPSGKEQSVPETYHPFPPPSVLAAPEVSAHLRLLGFGYRADFIQKTARMLVDAHGTARSADDPLEPPEKWLLTLRQMNTTSAREELLKFVGVGRKVADCIMLMSLDKKEVIPVDTHVHQIAVKHYGLRASSKTQSNMTPKLYEEVSSKLALVWGDYAGWAHSVLFTSDLKSFSSYGLSSPSPTPSVKPHRADKGIATPPDTPSPSLSKRKRSTLKHSAQRQSEDISISMPGESRPDKFVEPEGLNLADRVKRRRRAKESTC